MNKFTGEHICFAAILAILLSGPGPGEYESSVQLPSQHMLDHEANRSMETLNVSGYDGGRSLNRTVYGFLHYRGH